jgi:hypothetical protein
MKSILTTTVLMTSISMFSGTAQASHSVEELAYTLRNQAAQACRKIRHNYWETPQSQHLYKDVYEVYRQSNHIYTALHRGETLRHLHHDLEELDDSLHHAEKLAEKMKKHESRYSRSNHVYYDSHGGFRIRIGHGRGYRSHNRRQLRQLEDILEEMLDTVHDLTEEVENIFPKRKQIAPPVPAPSRGAAVLPIRAGRYSFSLSIR